MTKDLIRATQEPAKKALQDAKLSPSDIDEVILVGGSTRIPAVQEWVKNYFNKEPNRSINPDEVVALGAGIQGGILSGDVKDVLLLDIAPLSLGIETLGGVCTKIIERNTTIPVKKSQVFSTAENNQPAVTIHVLQGERPMAATNVSLGRFDLTGIPPAQRGVPQIEVTFDIDANGIVHVGAKDLGTGKENKIVISGSKNLSDEDIEKMVKDAQSHEAEDQRQKELIDIRNKADQLVFSTENALKEHGDKIPDEEKKKIEEELEKVKKVKENGEKAELEQAISELEKVAQTLAQELYKQAQADQQQNPGANPDNSDKEVKNDNENKKDDVQEAEIVDEEDKK